HPHRRSAPRGRLVGVSPGESRRGEGHTCQTRAQTQARRARRRRFKPANEPARPEITPRPIPVRSPIMADDLGLNEYQRLAGRTAEYPGRGAQPIAAYPALGLAGEAGEVCEQIKKALRDDAGRITPERHENLKKELGDVL